MQFGNGELDSEREQWLKQGKQTNLPTLIPGYAKEKGAEPETGGRSGLRSITASARRAEISAHHALSAGFTVRTQ